MRTSPRFSSASILSILFLTLTALPVSAVEIQSRAGDHAWCGTDGLHSNLLEAEARHRLFDRRAKAGFSRNAKAAVLGAAAVRASAPEVLKEGKVAVINDDGRLVRDRNPFDRSNRAVNFRRKKNDLRALSSGAGINQDVGERVTNAQWGTCNPDAEPGDDATFRVSLPFKVKFYGKKYKELYINSDGTVTFGAPDCSSLERSLSRLLGGPAVIAALFADLDPGATFGENGVFVKKTNNSVRITWRGVPQFGFNDSNTFQMTISKNKAILAHGDISTQEAIFGASPGGGAGVDLVDFSEELPVARTSAAIVEEYSLSTVVDVFGVPEIFYSRFKDDYDYIVVWNDFAAPVGAGAAFARHFGLINEVEGIGQEVEDFSSFVGSDGRLGSLMEMGELAKYPLNLNQEIFDTNSALDVIAHETGHKWLAFTSYMDDGTVSGELLGRDAGHWNFFFDSDESLLQGNDIMDLTGGFFETVGATSRFSKFDQYLMGFVPPEEVPPMFYVRSGERSPDSGAEIGVRFDGNRKDLTVEDVIAVHGDRDPTWEDSPRSFKMAFVLLGKAGEPVRQESINRLNSIINEWIPFFKAATDGHASLKMALKEKKKGR